MYRSYLGRPDKVDDKENQENSFQPPYQHEMGESLLSEYYVTLVRENDKVVMKKIERATGNIIGDVEF